MTDVEPPVGLPEAARRHGLTVEETFDLVFSRRLRSVASESGRRLVPVDAIADWLSQHGTPA